MLIRDLIDAKQQKYTRCDFMDDETNRKIYYGSMWHSTSAAYKSCRVDAFPKKINENRVVKMYYQVQPQNSKDRVTMYDLAYVKPKLSGFVYEHQFDYNYVDILMLTGKHAGNIYRDIHAKKMTSSARTRIGHGYGNEARYRFLFNEYYSEEIGYYGGDLTMDWLLDDCNGNPKKLPRYVSLQRLVSKWKRDNSCGYISQLIAKKQAKRQAEKLAAQKLKEKQEEKKLLTKAKRIEQQLFDEKII